MLTKIELTDVKVKLIGTTAVVTSLADVDGTNEGAPMHGTYRYTRVYSRLPSGNWKITNFEATRVGPPPEPGARRGRAGNPPYEGNSPPGRTRLRISLRLIRQSTCSRGLLQAGPIRTVRMRRIWRLDERQPD